MIFQIFCSEKLVVDIFENPNPALPGTTGKPNLNQIVLMCFELEKIGFLLVWDAPLWDYPGQLRGAEIWFKPN